MKTALALRDLPLLRGTLLFAVLLSLFGLTLLKIAHDGAKEMREQHGRILAQHRNIRENLSRLATDEREIRQKLARYEDLVKHGYLNQEQRLEWVEQIRRIKVRRKLIEVNYELAAQQSLDKTDSVGYELMSSAMKLQMRLLHEEDLLNFLADLRGSVRAYLRIRSCALERLPKSNGRPSDAAELKAECLIDWITLRERP